MTTAHVDFPKPTGMDIAIVDRCSPKVRARRAIEIAVVRKLAECLLLDAGLTVHVDDGDELHRAFSVDDVVREVFELDDALIRVSGQRKGWVKVILGNSGWDSVSDYTTNLDDIIKPANDYADALSYWC